MAQATGKIKNVSGEARTLGGPHGRFVAKGATIDVDLDEVYGYTQQAIWEPVDAAAKKAHKDGEADYERRLAEDLGLVESDEPAPGSDQGPATTDDGQEG
jgi:hypothetical protein